MFMAIVHFIIVFIETCYSCHIAYGFMLHSAPSVLKNEDVAELSVMLNSLIYKEFQVRIYGHDNLDIKFLL